MKGGLKPYPATKDSGLPWGGNVPEHWNLTPNRALMRRRKVLVGSRHAEYQLLSLTKAGMVTRDVESGKGKFSADLGTSQQVRVGDLVFCLFDVPETPRTVGLSRHNGMITGAYTVFECHDSSIAPFLDCFYRAMDDGKLLSPLYSGLRHTIPPTRLLGTKTPMPPEDERIAIVRFLDYVDRRIRRYIMAKQKLIKLLEEQKRAIIHRAVTRGLDPSVRLKPSCIDWLGDIPEHWDVRKVRSLFGRHGSGTTPAGDAYFGGEVPWVMTGDLKDGVLVRTKRTVTKQALSDVSALRLYPAGSLLVAMYGATIGKTGVLAMEACTNQACCVLADPRYEANVEYFQAVMNIARPQLIQESYGGGQPNINAEIVRGLRVPIPPRAEQDRIIATLRDSTRGIEETIDRTSREIAFLGEYRTRLIADVVTGKLDVREASANLPDELDEDQIGDEAENPTDGEGETEDLDVEFEEADA